MQINRVCPIRTQESGRFYKIEEDVQRCML